MKKVLFISILFFCPFVLLFFCCSQVNAQLELNFDFEAAANNTPVGWKNFGTDGYALNVDSVEFVSGKRSASIECTGEKYDYKAWSYSIPANYQGKRIKLTGFVKTENVAEGWAGLWLRIDPRLAFENMEKNGITGTTDWKKYEIELDYDASMAKQIVLGGLLVGKGKMWIDNLNVTIDGKDLKEVPAKELMPAEKDKEFDNGSGIEISKLDKKMIGDLEILGRVWGFLKYHHPQIAKGNLNWDYELFRILPDFMEAKKSSDRESILMNWVEKTGNIELCKTCPEVANDAFLKPDFSWMKNELIGEGLKRKLEFIWANRSQGNHFYIGSYPNVGNPEFKNELPYGNMLFPDDGFRLLALYKYWNMIHYFFPYTHLMDKEWNLVLREYIPTFLNARNELEYERAAIQIIGDIQDTHANLWGGANAVKAEKGKYYPPVNVKFIENKLIVTDYYNDDMKDAVGLEIGDEITSINGEAIKNKIAESKKYYPASNLPTLLRNLSKDLLISKNETIEITLNKNGTAENRKLNLFPIDSLDYYSWYRKSEETCYRFLQEDIGYITLKSIKEEDIPEIKKSFKDTKGIVIDIRNYPSAFVPFSLGSYFVSDTTAFVKFTIPNTNTPGEFFFGSELKIPPAEEKYSGKLVVLVNEYTQSQAEYTSMAFRAGDNTTIIGSTTAGADGNVSTIFLPGGLRTMISGIGVYYPDGTETQRVGIVPDIEVKPTVKGIRESRDELLERAVEFILGN